MSEQRAFTVRIPEEQAEELEAIAASDDASLAEEVRIAIADRIAAKRADPGFQEWLREHTARNKRIMTRLAVKKASAEDRVAESTEAVGGEDDAEPGLVVRHVQRRAEEA